ncbi:MAG: hypothetical protein U0805_01665 [Pirellulales bacterium]
MRHAITPIISSLALLLSASTFADTTDAQIATILRVDKEGAGHAAAVPALSALSQQRADALLPILTAMNQANPRAANWLRGAFDAIADRTTKAGNNLDQPALEKFTRDHAHSPQARQLAFDWLQKIDPTAADRLVPGMTDDPCSEFRRLAVARVIETANKARDAKDPDGSKTLYQEAFQAALDLDQLDAAFDELVKLGEKPDLKRQLGMLTAWWLIGPFDHRKGIGFDTAYPPEMEVDLDKTYPGLAGDVAWTQQETDDRHGVFDINKLLGRHKGAVVYAFCTFESDRERPVEVRLGTPNGWKLWVNGKLLFAHEEYHLMNRMDQYRVPVTLQKGTNRLLFKICQNEQTEDWAQEWQIQPRICTASGAGVQPTTNDQPTANQ